MAWSPIQPKKKNNTMSSGGGGLEATGRRGEVGQKLKKGGDRQYKGSS